MVESVLDFRLKPSNEKRRRNRPRVVVCIPARNEETSIAMVILKAQEHADEIIVCDDGSVDMTKDIAKKLGAEVIVHNRNLGKGSAIKSLFQRAKLLKSDVIVTIDADGQHDARQISRLIEPIKNNEADVVIGSRYVKGSWTDTPFYRRIGLAMINWIYKIKYKGLINDTQSGFRAYSADALDVVMDCESSGYGIESEQINKVVESGLRITEVPISVRYRGLVKTSNKNPLLHGIELMAYAFKLIVQKKPFILLGLPGLLLIAVGLILGLDLIATFNNTRYFSIEITLLTFLSLILGIILLIASLIFYSFYSLKTELKNEGSTFKEKNDI